MRRYLPGFAALVFSGGCTAAGIFFAGEGCDCCDGCSTGGRTGEGCDCCDGCSTEGRTGEGCEGCAAGDCCAGCAAGDCCDCCAAMSIRAMSASRTSGSASIDASAASLGAMVLPGVLAWTVPGPGADATLIVFGLRVTTGSGVFSGEIVTSVVVIVVSVVFSTVISVVVSTTASASSSASSLSALLAAGGALADTLFAGTMARARTEFAAGTESAVFCRGRDCAADGLATPGFAAGAVASGDDSSVSTEPSSSAITCFGGRGPSSTLVVSSASAVLVGLFVSSLSSLSSSSSLLAALYLSGMYGLFVQVAYGRCAVGDTYVLGATGSTGFVGGLGTGTRAGAGAGGVYAYVGVYAYAGVYGYAL